MDHQPRSKWPRDRWHSAIKIQCLARRYIARRCLAAKKKLRQESLESLYFVADRCEAALHIQCLARQWLARRNVCRRKEALKSTEVNRALVLSRPELFSVCELPAYLTLWDDLLRSERDLSSRGTAYPRPDSDVFFRSAELLFRAIDVHERGVVDERYLFEIHDRIGTPAPQSVCGRNDSEEDRLRKQWCRRLIQQILTDSGRCYDFFRKTDTADPADRAAGCDENSLTPKKNRLSSLTPASVVSSMARWDTVGPGALNLNLNEFCTFLMKIAQE